jgi:CRP/FNR family cyclic AMP-dependent transcriptional regulator
MIRAMAAPVETLRNVPLFAGFGAKELERLAREFKERTFSEGSSVTREGSTGMGFFVIAEGNAEVQVGGERTGTLGPGDHFGEIALIDDLPRSATITATSDLRCYGLTSWEFRPFVEEHPQVAWPLLQTLARRLRAAQSASESVAS